MRKIGEITMEEISIGWKIREKKNLDGTINYFVINSIFLPIKKSGVLVGMSYEDIVYLPNKFNYETNVLEIFEADYLVGGIDPAIKIPPSILNELARLREETLSLIQR